MSDNKRSMADTEIKSLNIENVNFDDEAEVDAFDEAWMATGQAKMLDDFRRLREMGIVDADGNQLKTIVPADMLDPDADFGG